MSGHSKWSTIKHKKAAADAKRGQVFTRYIREITVAARLGGGDPEANPRLRAAVNAARAVNMPKDNIERAIARGAGGGEGASLEEVRYEGYGQAGVAILVDCMTDNRNRTVSDVRSAFTKGGGSLGETGCVSWMFQQKGLFVFDRAKVGEERLMEIGMEAGADDIIDKPDEGAIELTCAPADFPALQDAFEKEGLPPALGEIAWIPENTIHVEGEEAEKVLRLVERLEDLDDVQNVYANFDISAEEMQRLNA
ncbi:MAG TPA: YebC/PmpR family DNA-binding transcriptional regulator [Mariprofundaceae bacterium]|nr:YebC/PmpR family DNA-binding transcriptional regulator [Mariprofundaceae bacterium]